MQSSEKIRNASNFRWLEKRYLLALALIGVTIISSHAFLQYHLSQQKHTASVVNIAGRQRMLSEKITRLAFLLENPNFNDQLAKHKAALQEALKLFELSHFGLLQRQEALDLGGENSEVVTEKFAKLSPLFENFLSLGTCFAQPESESCGPLQRASYIRLVEVQQRFIAQMNDIVFQYSYEGDAATERIQYLEYFLAGVALLLLALEFFLIFKPTTKSLERQTEIILETVERAEEAEANAIAASKAKSEFLSNMSHELRTPMASILGFSDEILDPLVTESEMKRSAKVIRKSGRLLLDLLNDILDFSKIEAGKLDIVKEEVSLAPLISHVETLMRVKADKKNIALKVVLETPVPETITTDSLRLNQILVNLLGNAIKFTEEGAVTLFLNYAPSIDQLEIAVQDTGIGISAEQQESIFEAFKQADSSITRKFGGTGLGLSISLALSKKLGGRISLKSEPGIGTTFRFTLPHAGAKGSALLEEIQSAVPETESTEYSLPKFRGKVLLVEDTEDIQIYLMRLLRKLGLEVRLAQNGKRAISITDSESFDLVLMDMQMPVMDGYTAASKLRERGFQTPIVALTASATAAEQNKCYDAGCTDYLAKPFKREAFYNLLAKYLSPVEKSTETEAAPLFDQDAEELDAEERELLNNYLSKLNERVHELKEAFDGAKWEELNSLAHKISGSAGFHQMSSLSNLAKSLELAAAKENKEVASSELSKIEALVEQIN